VGSQSCTSPSRTDSGCITSLNAHREFLAFLRERERERERERDQALLICKVAKVTEMFSLIDNTVGQLLMRPVQCV